MKVCLYQIEVFQSALDWTHGFAHLQNRLYIPGKGVLGYRAGAKIDFFREDEEVIEEAQSIVEGKEKGKFIGQVDLPPEVVEDVVSLGRRCNFTRAEFKRRARALVELIKG